MEILLYLSGLQDPIVFLPLLFVYSILVAVVLPTPVEVALLPLLAEPALYGLAALTVGAGKAAGSGVVFLLGIHADKVIEKASSRHRLTQRFTELCLRFVERTRYMGLFLLLMLPFMSDTVPVYVYSLFNHDGAVLSARYFVFTNFLAGVNRALLILIVLVALGVNLLV